MPRRPAIVAVALVLPVLLAACSSTLDSPGSAASNATAPQPGGSEDVATRLAAIQLQVTAWREAPDLGTARAAAEGARNLVVGPDGPGYGDSDGDGVTTGESAVGLLPGLEGEGGLALDLADNGCVEADVLGGSWDDSTDRWAILDQAIADWRPDNNTMPTLPSHPQRIVGWATFTLAGDSLELAHEYAGHAQLHVDVSLRALACAASPG